MLPLARSEGLLFEEIGDERVILDTESKQAHCLSPLASAVFAHCDGQTPTETLAELAGSRLGKPVGVEDVEVALGQLEERALLAAPPVGDPNLISRRALVRKTTAATAAVVAAPMITSIVTPAFAQGTFVDERCPRALCSSQGRGDDFCNCINDCPCVTPGSNACDSGKTQTCAELGQTPPLLDSCECLKCPGHPNPTDEGDFSGAQETAIAVALCPPEWFTSTNRPACGNSGLSNGGCEPGKFIDGVCVRIDLATGNPIGDTSEPCPT
jgi:hypothetical protein